MEMSSVNILKEMTDIRDGRMVCLTLSSDDVLHIIDDIYLNLLFCILSTFINYFMCFAIVLNV